MKEADWPYEDIDKDEPITEPTWECPEKKCQCGAPHSDDPSFELAVMLCEPNGKRMPGARCRVVANGMLANPDMPNADDQGWISVKLERAPETLLLEWAPGDTPDEPELPYRRRYYAQIPDDDREEAARRRLSNLGFSFLPTLRENIEDFQVEYERTPTGEIDDVEDELKLYHDEAMLPVREGSSDPGSPRDKSGFRLMSFGPMADPNGSGGSGLKPQAPPKPPAQGAGNKGSVQQQGTGATSLASILTIMPGHFVWRKIDIITKNKTSKKTELWGQFWVFEDALKDKANGRRWPCSAVEAQKCADQIKVSPTDLPGWENGPTGSAYPKVESIFMTTRICDERWEAAKNAGEVIIPHGQQPNTPALLVKNNTNMNAAVDADLKALTKSGATQGPWAADPGKYWVLSNALLEMDFTKKPPVPKQPPKPRLIKSTGKPAAANYGWHVEDSKTVKSKGKTGRSYGGVDVHPTSIANQWVIEPGPSAHDNLFLDYSQILILVAGWCHVTDFTQTPPLMKTMKTADVYTSPDFFPLITDGGVPLAITKQPISVDGSDIKTDKKLSLIEARESRLARIQEAKSAAERRGEDRKAEA